MKTLYINIIAITVMLLTATNSYSQISKAEITATGLTCSMCSNAINKQLKSMTEIDSVSTDLNTNTFTVHFADNNTLTPKVLKDAVEKAGFFVGTMILTAEFAPAIIEDTTAIKVNGDSYIFIDAKHPVSNTAAKYKILDKGFVTQKEYKKLVKSYSKHPSYLSENEGDYHLKEL